MIQFKKDKWYSDNLSVYEFDEDGEVELLSSGDGNTLNVYLDIEEVKQLVEFLQKQLEEYDNR